MRNKNVTCRQCGNKFTGDEWLNNKICENPRCNCPKVQEAMRKTEEVIQKASQPVNKITITTTMVPTRRNEQRDQLYIDMPPVMSIEVSPPRKQGTFHSNRNKGGR